MSERVEPKPYSRLVSFVYGAAAIERTVHENVYLELTGNLFGLNFNEIMAPSIIYFNLRNFHPVVGNIAFAMTSFYSMGDLLGQAKELVVSGRSDFAEPISLMAGLTLVQFIDYGTQFVWNRLNCLGQPSKEFRERFPDWGDDGAFGI